MPCIYLDHNASTPIDPNVADAMRSLLDVAFGNPSSEHWAGRPPKAALEKARAQGASTLITLLCIAARSRGALPRPHITGVTMGHSAPICLKHQPTLMMSYEAREFER